MAADIAFRWQTCVNRSSPLNCTLMSQNTHHEGQKTTVSEAGWERKRAQQAKDREDVQAGRKTAESMSIFTKDIMKKITVVWPDRG